MISSPLAPEAPPSALYRYAVVASATCAALALRWLLDPWLGDSLPFVFLFGAVAASMWFGGRGAAVLGAAIGGLASFYQFVEPRGTFAGATLGSVIGFGAYLVTCAVIIAFGELMRRAQHRAAEQHQLLLITLSSIGDAVVTTDLAGGVTSMNAAAESLTGWSQAEAQGQPLESVLRIVSEETRQPLESPVARALQDGATVRRQSHAALIRKDGSERRVDDSAAPIRDERGKVSGGVLVLRDVTERREREQRRTELFEAAGLLASIVTSSHDAIISKSLDGIIQTWNAGAERLFGYPSAEAVGRHISLIVPSDRLQEQEEIVRRLRAGELIDHFFTVRRRKDGELVHVSLTISPLRDEAGQIVGASKIARDISDQQQVEDRIDQLVADLQRADRRKDEFLATLAHELRGPLAPVRNSLEILKLARGDESVIAQARAMLERQVALMERLIEDLLDLSRITHNRLTLRRERLDVCSALHQAVDSCRPACEASKHSVTVAVPPEPLVIEGDTVRLIQVFSNLVNNACKYTDPGGSVAIRADRENGEAIVSVKDNGVGIPPALLPRILDLFQQAEQRPERSQGGLGIGLSLVKQFVELHDGRVEAYSNGPGHGSEFVVRLPLA